MGKANVVISSLLYFISLPSNKKGVNNNQVRNRRISRRNAAEQQQKLTVPSVIIEKLNIGDAPPLLVSLIFKEILLKELADITRETGEKVTIFLIEDEPFGFTIIHEVLQKAGYNIQVV